MLASLCSSCGRCAPCWELCPRNEENEKVETMNGTMSNESTVQNIIRSRGFNKICFTEGLS